MKGLKRTRGFVMTFAAVLLALSAITLFSVFYHIRDSAVAIQKLDELWAKAKHWANDLALDLITLYPDNITVFRRTDNEIVVEWALANRSPSDAVSALTDFKDQYINLTHINVTTFDLPSSSSKTELEISEIGSTLLFTGKHSFSSGRDEFAFSPKLSYRVKEFDVNTTFPPQLNLSYYGLGSGIVDIVCNITYSSSASGGVPVYFSFYTNCTPISGTNSFSGSASAAYFNITYGYWQVSGPWWNPSYTFKALGSVNITFNTSNSPPFRIIRNSGAWIAAKPKIRLNLTVPSGKQIWACFPGEVKVNASFNGQSIGWLKTTPCIFKG